MMLASALIFLAAFSALQAATVPVVNHAPATAATVQDTDSAWSLGTIEIAGLGGGGSGKVYDAARTPTSIVQVIGRVAYHLGPTGSGWLRGNVSFAAEGVGAWIDQDPTASGAGLNILFRYTWAAGRWRPMFLGGDPRSMRWALSSPW